jgi:CBS domain-containing protein
MVAAMPTIQGPLLSAQRVIRAPLVDSRGERLGRVEDLLVRLADGGYPPVTGLVASIGGRQLFVPASRISALEPGKAQLSGDTLDLRRFERRAGEVLLHEDVLDRHLIDVSAGRLVRAGDVELARIDDAWRLVGVDPAGRRLLSRLLGGGGGERGRPTGVVDWSDVEPFVGHVPSARLLLPLRRLRRLHPAQIADIVEGASHDEGEEILSAVEADPELEADVFEELDTHHQVEFLEDKSDQEIAEILGEMAPDDAADLLAELDQDRRRPVLEALPPEQQRKVRSLLSYNPETAGGMMSPDFVSVSVDGTAADALEAVRTSSDDLPPLAASTVFITDGEGRLQASVSVVELLRAASDRPLRDYLAEPVPPHIHADESLEQVALTMADFNMSAAAVVERADRRIIGVITSDDLIEALIPRDWRRRQIAQSGD